MKAVIPAAGLGTRFLPATKAQPKEMLPVYDKPTIQYVVEEAVASGIDSILVITGRNKRAIEDHFDRSVELEESLKKGSYSDKLKLKEIREISDLTDHLYFVRQKEQRGLGDAIRYAEKFVGDEPFAVLLGDTITIDTVPCTQQLINLYEKYKSPIITIERVVREKISTYGIIKPKKKVESGIYEIEDMIEKPKPEVAPSNLGIVGRYVLTPEIFDYIEIMKPGIDREIQLTDALRKQTKSETVYGHVFNGKRYDIGNRLDWLKATVEFAMRSGYGKEFEKYLKDLVKGFK